jgi:16S rRNA (cytosine967-C5)-methyltransferase
VRPVAKESIGVEPRRAALKILGEVREGKPYEDVINRGVARLTGSDRRLAHELAAGVLRQRTSLDARLAPLVPRGWDNVDPRLQDILRLGAYQLTALDRVPIHAAVDTSVELAKSTSGARSAGFVNAILRRLVRTEDPTPTSTIDEVEQLSAEYSHTAWLVQSWMQEFWPNATRNLLAWNNTRPRLVLQAARKDLPALASQWCEAGIEVENAPYGAGLMTNVSRPWDLPGYADGDFMVQDPAQALLMQFSELPSNGLVYDVCAAPGGKTIALGRDGRMVIAGDVSRARANRLAENIARAGSGREAVVVADGRSPPVREVDAVLLDVPCLGTGTFARNPDARWRVSPGALASLLHLQAELLHGAAEVVKPGGLLIYSTCSLEPEENRLQVDRFLDSHSEFRREPVRRIPSELLSTDGDLMILPHRHGVDGAFGARLRRTA